MQPNSQPHEGGQDETRRQVIYHGRVQGVGFRATVFDLASDWPVAGFVRNVENGTVELMVCGETGAVDEFLRTIRLRFSRNIIRAEESEPILREAFSGFEVRR